MVNPATPAGQKNLKFLFDGLYYTIALSLTAICISIIVGLLIALPGLSTERVPRSFNRFYVELVRSSTSRFDFMGVLWTTAVAGISISVFWAGVLALSISDGAFQAEIFRAGIQSINRGQYEAASSISLNYRDTMRYVILPKQSNVFCRAWEAAGIHAKMSSLVSVIGMQELTHRANELVVTEYRPLEITRF